MKKFDFLGFKMCVILDLNINGDVFQNNPDPAKLGGFVKIWLDQDWGSLVFCPQLLADFRGRRFRGVYAELHRKGKGDLIAKDLIENKIEEIRRKNKPKSNPEDHLILALGAISCAKVLVSNDRNLQKDFKNPKIVRKGKIVSKSKGFSPLTNAKKLLNKSTCKRSH